jgi:hypothetical protein
MNSKSLVQMFAFAFLVSLGSAAQAQDFPLTFKIALKALVQLDDSQTTNSVGDVIATRHATKAVKVTTANLISLLSSNYNSGTPFPAGSTIQLIGSDTFVVDKTTNQTDVTPALSITFSDPAVVSGQEKDNGAQNTVTTAYTTITFDDGNGTAFVVTGLTRKTVSASASTNKTGDSVAQKEAETITGLFSGTGTVGGAAAVFSGTATASGKNVIPAL